MDIKEVLLLWFITFCDKKTSGSGVNNEIKQNQELPKELHKPIIKKLKKRIYLADMQLISKFFIKKLGFHYVSFIFLVNMHGCSFKR